MTVYMYQGQYLFGLIFISLLLSYKLYRKIHWSVGFSYAYFSSTCIPRMVYPQYFYTQFDISTISGFENLVNHAYISITTLAVFFLFFRISLNFFVLLAVLDAFMMLIRPDTPYFLFNNPAIDVSFIACTLPIAHNYFSKNLSRFPYCLLMGLLIAPLIYTKTSSGILGLMIICAMYAWNTKYRWFAILSPLPALIFGYVTDPQFLNSSGRFPIWKMATTYWWEQGSRLFGKGLGTFQIYGPALQIAQAMKQGLHDITLPGFTWMHNDWLQVLFESGVLGLLALTTIVAVATYKARKRPALITSIVTYSTLATIQMPLRWFIFSFFGASLIVCALTEAHSPQSPDQKP